MDLFLLQAVASESAGRLVDRELLRVAHLGQSRYLLRFASPGRDNLLISVRPDLPRFHLLPPAVRVREERPDGFAGLLEREIGGAILRGLETRRWDRVVELRFDPSPREGGAADRRLVVELFGRSANMLLLDAAGTVVGYARDLRSAFRSPLAGAAYEPPVRRPGYDDLPTGAAALAAIRARWADPAAFLEPISPALSRDLRAAAAGNPEKAAARLERILESVRAQAWEPVVYSSRELAEFAEGDAPGRDDLLVVALPLEEARSPAGPGGPRPITKRFASPSEAAAAAYGLAERLRDFLALREHHQAVVSREIGRLCTLARKLEAELAAARGGERFRRLGEALLAGLRAARVAGREALVPDPLDPDAGPLRVPIDPARSLPENAQALFRRYKKSKRGLATIESRLAAVRERLGQWRALQPQAAEARSSAALEALREAMARLGLVHARGGRRSVAVTRAPAAPARVRRHTSPDGFVILVGRSGGENDALTFGVAAPWDFWLHAAGHPGAHVVVRNPQRLKSLPAATLRLAAGIAAFYSGARAERAVEVHYTQRKHVRKRKGMPRGQVLVRRFRSIRVAPLLPTSTVREI